MAFLCTSAESRLLFGSYHFYMLFRTSFCSFIGYYYTFFWATGDAFSAHNASKYIKFPRFFVFSNFYCIRRTFLLTYPAINKVFRTENNPPLKTFIRRPYIERVKPGRRFTRNIRQNKV